MSPLDGYSVADALSPVISERARQDRKWGTVADRYVRRTPDRWLTILTEEVGEVAKSLNDHESRGLLRMELAQVAAVAVAWIEALDRGGPVGHKETL